MASDPFDLSHGVFSLTTPRNHTTPAAPDAPEQPTKEETAPDNSDQQ